MRGDRVDALEIPARSAEYSLTESALTPFQAEPTSGVNGEKTTRSGPGFPFPYRDDGQRPIHRKELFGRARRRHGIRSSRCRELSLAGRAPAAACLLADASLDCCGSDRLRAVLAPRVAPEAIAGRNRGPREQHRGFRP